MVIFSTLLVSWYVIIQAINWGGGFLMFNTLRLFLVILIVHSAKLICKSNCSDCSRSAAEDRPSRAVWPESPMR